MTDTFKADSDFRYARGRGNQEETNIPILFDGFENIMLDLFDFCFSQVFEIYRDGD
jgi:hypothetical protein